MLKCADVTERATDFLEGDLSLGRRLQLQMHLAMCRACRAFVRQIRLTTQILRRLPPPDVAAPARERLLERYRNWRSARIEAIPPDLAEGELRGLYGEIASMRGSVADIHIVQSLNPRALKAHLDLYKAVIFAESTLPRIARERIGVVVSSANRCEYCVVHHSEALRQLGDDKALIESLARGELPEGLGERDLALLRWAREGALNPSEPGSVSLHDLRTLGFDDRAILDASLTLAYFSYVNRLVPLLGVKLEADVAKHCREASG